MAVVAEFRTSCGALVVIHDDAYAGKTAEELKRMKAEGDRVIAEIFAKGYLERQAACRERRERELERRRADAVRMDCGADQRGD